MQPLTKFSRLLQLLVCLSENRRYHRDELIERFGYSKRSFYRDIRLIKEANFWVNCEDSIYWIEEIPRPFKGIQDLLHFTEEEAYILQQAILSIANENQLKHNLIRKLYKLYKLYDFNEIAELVVKKEYSANVEQMMHAIKHKKQAMLYRYKSSHTEQISDRLVEPFDFTTNLVNAWCYEIKSGENKLFKISRIGTVKELNTGWQYETHHQAAYIDPFRMSNTRTYFVKLEMTLQAANLMQEEYPLTEQYIYADNHNQYLFDGWVCHFHGIGRFILGLPDDITVIKPESLKDYLNAKVRKF